MATKEYGTYKDGSVVYKDKQGYYIYQWDNVKKVEYKKYLKNWHIHEPQLILDKKTKKWKIVKSKKPKKSVVKKPKKSVVKKPKKSVAKKPRKVNQKNK